MDFEIVNEKIGGCGTYQYILFFLLSITTFKYAGEYQSLTFALYEAPYQCIRDNNNNTDYNSSTFNNTPENQCYYISPNNNSTIECTNWIYGKEFLENSLVMEFNLVCSREYYRNLIFTLYFVGCVSSYPLIMLSDYTGRRRMLLITVFLSVILTCLLLGAAHLWQYIVLFTLIGANKSIYTSMAYATLIETIPVRRMDIVSNNFWIFYSFGYVTSAATSFYGRSWRYISIFSLTFTIFYFLYFFFVHETPRWLMLNNMHEKSFKTLSFIATVNHRKILKKDFEQWRPIHEPTGRFWNIFKYKIMIYRLAIFSFAAWSFSFAYIGSSVDLTFASRDIFITTFTMGLMEVPAPPIGGICANKFGRKKSFSILTSLVIVCLIPLPFFETASTKSIWQPWVKLFFAMSGKLCLIGAWGIFDVIINELAPTTYRNCINALVYVTTGILSIFAPSLIDMASDSYYATPCLIYGASLSITVLLIMLFIPETHHLPIPQTIEQTICLKINKEQEWKEYMMREAESQGMDQIQKRTIQ